MRPVIGLTVALDAECTATSPNAYSQAIGDGLAVMATAEDGVIEALYHTAHPYIRLYQWHPERLCDKDEAHLAPFVEFIAACN